MVSNSYALETFGAAKKKSDLRTLGFSAGAGCLLLFVALLWFLGSVSGVVAILFVAGPRHNYKIEYARPINMYIVTYVFGGLDFFLFLILGLKAYYSSKSCGGLDSYTELLLAPPLLCAFALLWIENIVGVPSENVKALYCTYFVAKRLWKVWEMCGQAWEA